MATATVLDPTLEQLIDRIAPRYRLDPRAVKIVALGEGSIGGAYPAKQGDYVDGRPTSYGPFQLHAGGALPGQYAHDPAAADAFANSPAGIDYALSKMAENGAADLTGLDAVEAIIRNFERPANPEQSINVARGRWHLAYGASSSDAAAVPVSFIGDVRGFGKSVDDWINGHIPGGHHLDPVAGGIKNAVSDKIKDATVGAISHEAEQFGAKAGHALAIGGIYAALTVLALALMSVGLMRSLGLAPTELATAAATRGRFVKRPLDDDEIPF